MDETKNDAPFVAFYDMHAVTFVPPDEMADVTIAGLQWFILIPPIKPHGVITLLDRVENTVGKGENAGYQHFLLFSTVFSKASFLRVVNSRDCVIKS